MNPTQREPLDKGVGAWRLGDLIWVPASRTLSAGHRRDRLPPKPAAVLDLLIEKAPQAVSKEQILERIWPGQVVADSVIVDAVKRIRREESAWGTGKSIIRTVHRHGYRLGVEPRSTEPPRDQPPPQQNRSRLWVAAAVCALLVGVGLPALWRSDPGGEKSHPPSTAEEYLENGLHHYAKYQPRHNRIALLLFREAIAHQPDSPLAHAALASACAQQFLRFGGGNQWLECAVYSATRAIQLDPLQAAGHGAMGVVHTLKGERSEAERRFRQAVTLDPGYFEGWYNLGIISLQNGQPAPAASSMERALAVRPDHFNAYIMLGRAMRTLGRYQQAEQAYHKALEQDPCAYHAEYGLAELALTRGRDELARQRVQSLLDRFGNRAAVHLLMARVLGQQGDFDGARAALEEAAQWAPAHSQEGAMARARYLALASRAGFEPEPAMRTGLLQVMDRHAERWIHPARIRLLLALADGDTAAAISHLAHAVDAGWSDPVELRHDPLYDAIRDQTAFNLSLSSLEQRLFDQQACLESPDDCS